MKQNEKKNKKNTNVCDKASDLYNNFPQIFFDEYYEYYQMLKKKKKDPDNLFIKTYIYDAWRENEEPTDATRKSDEESHDISNMSALEGDE